MTEAPVPETKRRDLRRVPALLGPWSGLGFAIILAICAIDQLSKLFVLRVLDLAHGAIRLGPFVDLLLTTNKGISYGWFQQEGPFGQWALLELKAIAVILLWLWLARAHARLIAVGLGLIIGGAIGNAIDRLAYGWVNDFILLKYWPYVFNLADVAIVFGVAALLYDAVLGDRAAKAPRSGR